MIKLIIDSSADSPECLVNDELVTIVPLTVIFGEKEYRDRVDISSKEFFEKLTQEKVHPKTSQVTPSAFMEVFKNELQAGNQVVCLTIAAAASGTYQSAVMAKNEINSEDILIIDSNSLCLGEAYIGIKILDWIKNGKSLAEIKELVFAYTQNQVRHLFSVDTLEYLKRGGRITGTKAFLAEVLNIKPILTVEDGITKPISKVRSRKKLIPYFIKFMEKEIDLSKEEYILIGYTVDKEFALEFEKEIKQKLNYQNPIYISEIGPTIGTHCGPNVLAVFYKILNS